MLSCYWYQDGSQPFVLRNQRITLQLQGTIPEKLAHIFRQGFDESLPPGGVHEFITSCVAAKKRRSQNFFSTGMRIYLAWTWMRNKGSFLGRKLSREEQNYSNVKKEELAIVFLIIRLYNFLFGRRVT